MAVDAATDLKIACDNAHRALNDILCGSPDTDKLRAALVKTITAVAYLADAIKKTREELGLMP